MSVILAFTMHVYLKKLKKKNSICVEKKEEKIRLPSPPPSCFPPHPLSNKLAEQIINGFCADSEPIVFQEAGCAVCGHLYRISDLSPLDNHRDFLNILAVKGVTR